ncbi:MAG: uroporphyrinogen-III synthase [Paracoccaceae bacterium]
MSPLNAALILTRPWQAGRDFARELGDLCPRLQIVESPLLEIIPTRTVPDFTPYKAVIFTSANGVRFCGTPVDLPAYCVGQATTQIAIEAGWHAEKVGETASELVTYVVEQGLSSPVLHIGGVHRRGEVAQKLTKRGVPTDICDVYDQKLCNLTQTAEILLNRELPAIVPLFSPRTARQFARQKIGIAPLHFVAISEPVLAEVHKVAAKTRTVALRPDAVSMKTALLEVVSWVETGRAPQ